jgi:hypothetical protein
LEFPQLPMVKAARRFMMPFPAGASIKNRAFAFENPSHIMLSHAQARELNLAIRQRDEAHKH